MRTGRSMLVAVVVGTLLAGLSASSAAAETPTWYECQAAPLVAAGKHGNQRRTGEYSNDACTKPNARDRGKYGLLPLAKDEPFHAGTLLTWRMTFPGNPEVVVPCSVPGEVHGTLVPPDEVKEVMVVLRHCRTPSYTFWEGSLATPPIAEPEEVALGPLAGRLGYLNSSTHEIGLALYSEAEPGNGNLGARREGEIYWQAGEGHGAQWIHWRGAVTGRLSKGVNEHGKSVTVKFEVGHYVAPVTVDGRTWSPMTNPPGFEDGTPGFEGGAEDVLLNEFSFEGVGPLRFPSGLEGWMTAEAGEGASSVAFEVKG